jgi:hypothetical protein
MHSFKGRGSLVCLVVGAVLFAGCAAGDPRFTADAPAGFWQGLWHGIISVITLIVGIFDDSVRVYEVHNTGGWYDFGFLFGVVSIWGGGGAKGYHSRCSRRDQREWEEIGRKVEAKLKRKIRAWAEAEPDEDWNVVEAKAEEKLKRRLREWAQEDEPRRG